MLCVAKKRCGACREVMDAESFSPCGAGRRRGVCRGCYAAAVREARAVRRSPRARSGVIVGTVAAETLEETIGLLRGIRVSIDRRIEDLGRMRSVGALLERARAENGGLPANAAAAQEQAGADLEEVAGTPGRIASRAAGQVSSVMAGAREAGPVVVRAAPIEELGIAGPTSPELED